jgi:hypothetical protein
MERHFLAQRWYLRFAVAAGVHMLGLCTELAIAGCGSYASPIEAPPTWSVSTTPTGAARISLYQSGTESVRTVADETARGDAIVGTWRFTFVSNGTAHPTPIPAGVPVDFGTQQWHADGTEFMISGARPPSTGDVCMGTWRKIGPGTYQLKHLTLAWASIDSPRNAVSPATFVAPAIIRATVRLNHAADGFQGTFTIDQYAADETTLLEHVGGKVTAARFSPD